MIFDKIGFSDEELLKAIGLENIKYFIATTDTPLTKEQVKLLTEKIVEG